MIYNGNQEKRSIKTHRNNQVKYHSILNLNMRKGKFIKQMESQIKDKYLERTEKNRRRGIEMIHGTIMTNRRVFQKKEVGAEKRKPKNTKRIKKNKKRKVTKETERETLETKTNKEIIEMTIVQTIVRMEPNTKTNNTITQITTIKTRTITATPTNNLLPTTKYKNTLTITKNIANSKLL